MKQSWELSAIDTLFFRESRPMEAPGSSELLSLFPPSARTLAGAIRSHIGESMGVNWQDFRKNKDNPVRQLIGYGDDFAEQLQFYGVWVHYKGERLYPAPLNLMVKQDDKQLRTKITQIDFIYIGIPCECDLGKKVHLPCLPERMVGSKSLNNHWLTTAGLQKVLSGKTPDRNDDIISRQQLLKEEHRLGIARDNQTRRVKEGMLYQTRHIRLNKNTALSIDVNIAGDNLKAGLIKLGGEGRMASLQAMEQSPIFPALPSKGLDTCKGIILYLLTPLLLPENSAFLPDFQKNETEQGTVWQGKINKISLTLVSSIIGKAQREGGWDMAKHEPIAVQSLLPAGSVFYCTVDNHSPQNIQDAMLALHNTNIGKEQHLGRGHLAVGLWHDVATKGANK
ncbi:MAG TPA: type III-B CRISPR module-associated protein Cmr3 [Leucothrix mucor]|nr:type III-B CRISPR module-associated protein Cmr3 [Leucothrix mucor]